MPVERILIYGLFALGLCLSLWQSPQKTRAAVRLGAKMLLKLLPSLLLIIGGVGLLLGFIPAPVIEHYLGKGSGYWGTLGAALFGSVTLIPNIIAMPLAASLLRSGAAVVTVAAFITTLTMVGIVTFPLEVKELGLKFAIYRNLLSFGFALFIAFLMGVVLT